MTITLHILSPEGTLLSEEVSIVTLPGVAGSFSVLPGHAPLITALAAGSIRYVKADGTEEHLPVKEGFVEVKDNQVRICAEV